MRAEEHEYISYIRDEVDYPRPLFELPTLSSPDANTFVMFGNFLTLLRQHGFSQEYEFIYKYYVLQNFGEFVLPRDEAFIHEGTNGLPALINFMNKFCDLNYSSVLEENDEYVVRKIMKKTSSATNNPLFKISNKSILLEMLKTPEEKELILSKNNFDRNILHYTSIDTAIELIKDKDLGKTVFEPDVFGQYFFSSRLTIFNFGKVINSLKETFGIDNDDLYEILQTEDSFYRTPVDYLLLDMGSALSQIEKMLKQINDNSYGVKNFSLEQLTLPLDILNTMQNIQVIDQELGDKLLSSMFDKKNPIHKETGAIVTKFLDSINDLAQQSVFKESPEVMDFVAQYKEFNLLNKFEKQAAAKINVSNNPEDAQKPSVGRKKV